MLEYLAGKKTYLFTAAVVVYAALAHFGVVPSVDDAIAAVVVIAGYAITFRSAITKVAPGATSTTPRLGTRVVKG